MRWLAVVCVLAIVTGTGPQPPENPDGPTPLRILHVAPQGSDRNHGTATAPWQTLQHAASQARPGDLILVQAGNYTGCNITVSGTAERPIIFRGETGAIIDTPIHFGGGVYGINASGREFLTIEGFTFQPRDEQTAWYSAIRLGGLPDRWMRGNIIRNNTVQMRQVGVSSTPDKYGLYASWQDGILVENNTVSGAYNSGIYTTENSRNYIIRGNRVCNVGGNGIHNNAGFLKPGVIKNALIEGNVIHNVGFGIGGQAISCDGVQDSRIQNNLLYDVHAKGIALYATNALDGSKKNRVVNNTVVTVGKGTPLRINHDCPGNVVANNICVASGATAAWIDAEESGLTGATFIDYNLVCGLPRVGGVKRNDWKKTYGFDAHSLASTPAAIFVNAGAKDYRLKAGSPAIRAGTTQYAPTTDLAGHRRDPARPPDLGAYQHLP
jgi:nitrous oxidase accessory protein NosD